MGSTGSISKGASSKELPEEKDCKNDDKKVIAVDDAADKIGGDEVQRQEAHVEMLLSQVSIGDDGPSSPLVKQISEFLSVESKRSPECEDISDLEQGKAEVARYRNLIRELSEHLGSSFLSMEGSATVATPSPKMVSSASFAGLPSFKQSKASKIMSDTDGNELQVNSYQLGSVLGVGQFGVVVKATNLDTNQAFAIKVIDRKRLRRKLLGKMNGPVDDSIKVEIAVQKRLRHKNILPLIEVIDSSEHPRTYLVMKLVNGGALMPDTAKWEPIPETRARFLFVQLVSALHYLHGLNIIHKDVKPSNLLVEKGSDRLYLSDFGVAQIFKEDELCMINSTDGTMAFIAPEMCDGAQFDGKKADIWAAGATLFMMVTGEPPFIANSAHDLVTAIAAGVVDYSAFELSEPLVDLLQNIMCKDLEKRFSWDQIAEHQWCTNQGEDQFLLPEIVQIEVSQTEIEQAVSPLSLSSFESVSATVWLAKRSLLKLRSTIDKAGSNRSLISEDSSNDVLVDNLPTYRRRDRRRSTK